MLFLDEGSHSHQKATNLNMPRSQIAPRTSQLPRGIFCPVVSLYKPTARQEIDLDASYKYFVHLIRGGCHGLVLAGSTAEAVLLSPAEKQDLLQVARKAALSLGVENYPLVAGISGQSTNESIRLAQEAAEAGANYGLLLPPSYWAKAVSKDVIVDFYREVADNSPVPVVIYNFPGVTAGVDLNSDVISELAQHPNIVGVKLTCANAGKVTRLTEEYTHEQFAVYAGQSDWLLPCLAGNGSGCVTGIGNVFPKSVCKLFSLWEEGNIKEAQKLQGIVAQAEKACKEGIAATKYGAGYFAGPPAGVTESRSFWPRKPYKPLGKEKQQWVVDVMGVLADYEKSLPDKYTLKAATNGANGH
jgi:dihydrodipicolinate synthase/N-acetylneuraminate lyase